MLSVNGVLVVKRCWCYLSSRSLRFFFKFVVLREKRGHKMLVVARFAGKRLEKNKRITRTSKANGGIRQ